MRIEIAESALIYIGLNLVVEQIKAKICVWSEWRISFCLAMHSEDSEH